LYHVVLSKILTSSRSIWFEL